MLLYITYVFFILLFTVWCLWLIKQIHDLKKDRAHWARVAVEETRRAEHWNKQFNEVIEGQDGAWARRLIEENKALDKGLDEAVDDHLQDQQTWEEARSQYKATIEDLEEQLHNVYEAHRLLKLDFDSVRETALAMQIEIDRSEAAGTALRDDER